MDAVEDTGFEAHLMGVADSRSLTLRLDDWPLAVGQAEEIQAALTRNFGVLHVTLDEVDGSAEVSISSWLQSKYLLQQLSSCGTHAKLQRAHFVRALQVTSQSTHDAGWPVVWYDAETYLSSSAASKCWNNEQTLQHGGCW